MYQIGMILSYLGVIAIYLWMPVLQHIWADKKEEIKEQLQKRIWENTEEKRVKKLPNKVTTRRDSIWKKSRT